MRQVFKTLKDGGLRVVDFVLPPRCPVSGDIVEAQGALSPAIWAKLNFIAPPYCRSCGVPFAFDQGLECASCMQAKKVYERARAAMIYDDASRSLILGFKHGDKTEMAPIFAQWMSRAGSDLFEDADVIVPVPLHFTRLVRRRYNQAALLTCALAKQTKIEAKNAALVRLRATPSQGHLNAKERARNVRKAFDVSPRLKKENYFKGKNVILVDDVLTSGATMRECAKVLKRYGANRIDILTLARVVFDADQS